MKTNIEKMIENWYLGGPKSDATFILNEVGFAMKEGQKILLPYVTPCYESGTVVPYQLTVADFFSGSESIAVQPVEVTTADEQNWIVCGVSKEALAVNGYDKCLSFNLKEVVEIIMECKQLDGLVIVAEGQPVYLAKITLETLVENPPSSYVTPIKCDITKLQVDAIVNAANVSLLGGGGVDGAIHAAAGPKLLEECKTLNGCKTGDAKITKGYDLPAKYVIHTVGPVFTGKDSDQYQLNSCYIKSLNLALEHGVRSIAFPCISSGVYGYPLNQSIPIAVLSVLQWFQDHPDVVMEVYLCCYDDQAYDLYQQFFKYVVFPERDDLEHKVDVHKQ